MRSLFEGVGVALVTPFIGDMIDYESVSKIIDRDIRLGAKAIVILATTGEGSTISSKERIEMIKLCKKIVNNRAKLIVGCGHNDFNTCYENTLMAKMLGADGALVVTPYYNKTTQRGIINYYELLSQLQFPLIVYNVPSRTGLNIELSTIEQMINTNPYIYGIKESTCDISRITRLCNICKDKIPVYSGEDALNYVFYCLGGKGCISVTANILPQKVAEVYNNVKAGKMQEALNLQNKLQKVDDAMFIETNPIPVKGMMHSLGLIKSDKVRLPLVNLEDKNQQTIDSIASDLPEEFGL